MKITKTLLFIFSFLTISGFLICTGGQTLEWVRTYPGPANGGESYYIATDEAGNIFVTGENFGSSIAKDIVTIKYTPAGDSLWTRRYSGGGECSVDGIAIDEDGNVYVTGFDSQTGQPKFITVKYSPTGEVLWQKLFSNSSDNRAVGIGIDDQGFVYAAGVKNESNSNGWGYTAVKYNPVNGDTIWTANYDYAPYSTEVAISMKVDGAGNVYICGWSMADSTRSAVVKFNSDGVLQWASLYKIPDISGFIHGNSIDVDQSGNVYIAGQAYNGATFDDYLIIKYYSDGQTAWIKTISRSTASDIAKDICADINGNIYVTGSTQVIGTGGSNDWDYLTFKLNAAGDILWEKTYNNGAAGPTQDEARALTIDDYGNCYVTGGSSVSPLYYVADFATIRYDSNGQEIWTIRHTSYFGGYDVALDKDYNIYICGAIDGDNALIKYSQPPIPVEFVSFTANTNSNNIELNWTTATETNNSGFMIERSSAGSNGWVKAGFVKGNGTTTKANAYSFIDKNVSKGSYSYRLKQIDFNGSFSYSNILNVDVNFSPDFALKQNYPNPFNPATVIKWQLAVTSHVILKVHNIIGQQIVLLVNDNFDAGSHSYEFNAANLNSGIYFYTIEAEGIDGSKFTSTKKMILLK